jgi:hypothetical protein
MPAAEWGSGGACHSMRAGEAAGDPARGAPRDIQQPVLVTHAALMRCGSLGWLSRRHAQHSCARSFCER